MQSTQPTVFVLFGATGDLAKRMVLPAFYQLAQHGLMPQSWLLIGNGRGDVAHEDFRTDVRAALDEFGDSSTSGSGRISRPASDSPVADSTRTTPVHCWR